MANPMQFPRLLSKEWLEKLLDHSAGKARTESRMMERNVSISITAGMNDKLRRIGGHTRSLLQMH